MSVLDTFSAALNSLHTGFENWEVNLAGFQINSTLSNLSCGKDRTDNGNTPICPLLGQSHNVQFDGAVNQNFQLGRHRILGIKIAERSQMA